MAYIPNDIDDIENDIDKIKSLAECYMTLLSNGLSIENRNVENLVDLGAFICREIDFLTEDFVDYRNGLTA